VVGILSQIVVENNALVLEETGTNRLRGSEPRIETLADGGDLAALDLTLQMIDPVAVDIIMYVIESLAAHTLEYKVAVVAYPIAKRFAIEGAFGPEIDIVLHPILNTLETLEVGLVEVLVLSLLDLLDRGFLGNSRENRFGEVDGHRLEGTEGEIEADNREEDNINEQTCLGIGKGDIDIEKIDYAQGETVAKHIAGNVRFLGHQTRKEKNIEDIIECQPEGKDAEKDVERKEISHHILETSQLKPLVPKEISEGIKHNQDDGRKGIFNHTSHLEETRHGDAEGIDALEITRANQGNHHERVHQDRLTAADLVGKDGANREGSSQNAIHPSKAKILNLIACIERHDRSSNPMSRGTTNQKQKQDISHKT